MLKCDEQLPKNKNYYLQKNKQTIKQINKWNRKSKMHFSFFIINYKESYIISF